MITTMTKFFSQHLITAFLILPFITAAFIGFISDKNRSIRYIVSILISLKLFLSAAFFFFVLIKGTGEYEITEVFGWIPSMSVSFRVGIDGISAVFILVASFIFLLQTINMSAINLSRHKMALSFFAFGCLAGFMFSVDGLLAFIFLSGLGSAMIAMSGFRPRAMIFILIALLLYFVGSVYVWLTCGTFDLVGWYAARLSMLTQGIVFVSFALAFGIFVPLVGMGIWTLDLCQKVNRFERTFILIFSSLVAIYGFCRFAIPMAPAWVFRFDVILMYIVLAGVFWGALALFVERDLKSISPYIMMSVTNIAVMTLIAGNSFATMGGILFFISSICVIFGLFIIFDMTEDLGLGTNLKDLAGVGRLYPVIGTSLIVFVLLIAGIPCFGIFTGIVSVFIGMFQTKMIFAVILLIGFLIFGTGIVKIAANFLGDTKAVEFSPQTIKSQYIIALALIFLFVGSIGVYPKLYTKKLEKSANAYYELSRRFERHTN